MEAEHQASPDVDHDTGTSTSSVVTSSLTEASEALATLLAQIRLAGLSLGAIALLTLVTMTALSIAWLLVITGACALLLRAGVPLALSAASFAVVHVLIATFVWRRIGALAENLKPGDFLRDAASED